LTFKPFTFSAGESYSFEISARQDEEKGTSIIEFLINKPPCCGSFSVTPSTGVERTTEFTFDANGYKDPEEHLPLRYVFKTVVGDDELDIAEIGISRILKSTLTRKTYSDVTINCHVYDALDAVAFWSDTVTLDALESTEREAKVKESVDNLARVPVSSLPHELNSLHSEEIADISNLVDAFDRLIGANPNAGEIVTNTTISVFHSIASTSGAVDSNEDLLSSGVDMLNAIDIDKGLTL
jgi:hypothetical protein